MIKVPASTAHSTLLGSVRRCTHWRYDTVGSKRKSATSEAYFFRPGGQILRLSRYQHTGVSLLVRPSINVLFLRVYNAVASLKVSFHSLDFSLCSIFLYALRHVRLLILGRGLQAAYPPFTNKIPAVTEYHNSLSFLYYKSSDNRSICQNDRAASPGRA